MKILKDGALRPDPDGVRPEAVNDPRLSDSQREHIRKLARYDPNAEVVGMDSRFRPVVQARLGNPRRKRRYALLRNGEPTHIATPIREQWSEDDHNHA